LEETNAVLKILIERREADKRELEEKVLANVKTLVDPYLRKLRENDLSPTQNIYLQILESNLADITAPFLRNLAMKYTGLTPKEVQVAVHVKDGKSTKQIAQIIDTTVRAVEFHRHSLRDKLNLRNKKANLRTFLMALP
jgi:DNA-binding CsgD family transcriptional regulator